MKTIAVMSRKGGAGKSTLAVHMATAAVAAGKRVMLVDMDPQRSSLEWARERVADWPLVMEGRAGALFTTHRAAEREGIDLLIVDSRSSADAEASEAARLADLCLIVVRPNFFDLQAVGRTVQLVENLRRPGLFVLNQAPVRRNGAEPRVIREAVDYLSEYRIPLAEVGLRQRAAYQNAMWKGLGAQEDQPDSQAAFEINSLWASLNEKLWPVAGRHVYRSRGAATEADGPLELAMAG
ncbi:AAA family ATPase [Brevundimonas sp.]|uniref:AAA family ATPase n=1 Tax=Brevundimonas sp. TaxID=1871086 RepID=UPI003D100704